MNIVELFAGERCFGREAERQEHTVYSIDWGDFKGLYKRMDIMNMQITDIPVIPDHVHASFDCTTYTIAAISTHRNGTIPKSDYAKFCDEVNQHVIALIKQWRK